MKLCCLVGGVQSTSGETLQRHREKPAGRGCGGSLGCPAGASPACRPARWTREQERKKQAEAAVDLSIAFQISSLTLPCSDWPEAKQEAPLAFQKGRDHGCQCRCPRPHAGCDSSCISGAACPHLSFLLHKLETTN